ncbi:MAG TPA: glucokinase [Candidatus Polarisedimenticolia bacterium]|nr:glucokinase [Candidatus Polarisedimenticolia bacterium]
MILAGDVGGTKTRLALFETDRSGRLRGRDERTYPSREYQGLGLIVARYQREVPAPIERAAFGVAGPVKDGVCVTTNLPWVIEAKSLAALLRLPVAGLLNDLESTAWGLGELGDEDTLTLQRGTAAAGNSAIIAAGTGLGEAGLFWNGRRHIPFATEGGHADFAPRSTIEDELLNHLRARFGRVSWERVVSGPGLVEVHDFLAGRPADAGDRPAGARAPTAAGPAHGETVEANLGEDRAATISHAALAGESEVALRALDLFLSMYGAEAGNLALKTLSTAGMYIGGGIAPRIVDRLKTGTFLEAFLDKGRMRPLLEAMPVRVVLNDRTALLGAARQAIEAEAA